MMIMSTDVLHADNVFIRSSLDSISPYSPDAKSRVAVVHQAQQPESVSSSADIAHGLRISLDFTLLTPAAQLSDPCPWSFPDTPTSIPAALKSSDILWVNTPSLSVSRLPPSLRVIAQPPRLTSLSKPSLLAFLHSHGLPTAAPKTAPKTTPNTCVIVLPAHPGYDVLPPVVRGRAVSYDDETNAYAHVTAACEAVARTLGATAPIRVDVHAYRDSLVIVGVDLNPLAAGARGSVPAVAAAARGLGWQELVQLCLKQAMTVGELTGGAWNWRREA
ncbi:hypothetical protein EDC01DRAFT_777015 [Geopyxis carbonaria]|nr:hypothetical protein EDC01DRAFT_777015 [Geopyxis carbonaria]